MVNKELFNCSYYKHCLKLSFLESLHPTQVGIKFNLLTNSLVRLVQNSHINFKRSQTHSSRPYPKDPKFSNRQELANSKDPDQTASERAV